MENEIQNNQHQRLKTVFPQISRTWLHEIYWSRMKIRKLIYQKKTLDICLIVTYLLQKHL